MDAIVNDYMAQKAANTQSAAQVKVLKGALEQGGEVAMTLIESATTEAAGAPRSAYGTGSVLNIRA
jgi:hypothetical protein